MTSHRRQFIPKLSLLQMKERTISSLLASSELAGLSALVSRALTELQRIRPVANRLATLALIFRAYRQVRPTALDDTDHLTHGLHGLIYSEQPRADRIMLDMELTHAFGEEVEPCYAYVNLWLDLYLGYLELLQAMRHLFRLTVDDLKATPLAPGVAHILLVTHATFREQSPERITALLLRSLCDQATDYPPITQQQLVQWKEHLTAAEEYLRLYVKVVKAGG